MSCEIKSLFLLEEPAGSISHNPASLEALFFSLDPAQLSVIIQLSNGSSEPVDRARLTNGGVRQRRGVVLHHVSGVSSLSDTGHTHQGITATVRIVWHVAVLSVRFVAGGIQE